MLNRGGYSLVALIVLNPVIILVYQAWAGPIPAPSSGIDYARKAPVSISRNVASVDEQETAKEDKSKCGSAPKECPRAE